MTYEQIADVFQTAAHAAVGQRRKYTNTPYSDHPRAVAAIVKTVPHTDAMIAAALLHDVVEDTFVTIDVIRSVFNEEIAEKVDWLTDVAKPSDGNRAIRMAMNRAHLAAAPPDVKTVKLADVIHNGRDIGEHDPNFSVVYFSEIKKLLLVLEEGDPTLLAIAWKMVTDFENKQLQARLAR